MSNEEDPISFAEEIAALEVELERATAQLHSLQEQWRSYQVDVEECREALARLRRTMQGKLPAASESRIDLADIDPVPIQPDTGRAPRGARHHQIEQICRYLGVGGDEFRTIDVLDILERVEDELSESAKAYVYNLMDSLAEDGLLEKTGRGQWQLRSEP